MNEALEGLSSSRYKPPTRSTRYGKPKTEKVPSSIISTIGSIASQAELSRNSSHLQMPFQDIQPEQYRECRICLEQEAVSNPLVSPCNCIGSVKYVHQSCLKSWLQKVYEGKRIIAEREKFIRDGLECQMCKQHIKFNYISQLVCLPRKQACQLISSSTLVFALLILFQLVDISSILYIVQFAATGGLDFGANNFIGNAIIISGLAFLVITLFASSYFFLSQFFIRRKFFISGLKPRPESLAAKLPFINSKHQIYPYPEVNPQNIE